MKYGCDVCAWEYDEILGYPDGGIALGIKWEAMPVDFEFFLHMMGEEQFPENKV